MLDPNEDPMKLLAKYEQGPEKKVYSHDDLAIWHRSQAYYDLIGYINVTSTAIQGIRISDKFHVSPVIKNLCGIIDHLDKFIDAYPPLEQPQRFGNRAYRTWSRSMHRDIFLFLEKAIPQNKCHLLNELGHYISQSFGNSTRIDYGTGHELSFIFFLCALFKSEILTEDDTVAAALLLFNKYLMFVRRLQRVYNMEPAGSQGVWSLDDYQFVPFIWGSAQLSYNAPFDPSKFLNEEIINEYKDDYIFISCIDYISKVKTGHFGEHSNQLWSITSVPTWIKINSGLVKMYQKEILSKFPVMQHVYFGELMSFDVVTPGTQLPNARLGFRQTDESKSCLLLPAPNVPQNSVASQLIRFPNMAECSVLSSTSDSDSTTTITSPASDFIRPRDGSLHSLIKEAQPSVFYPMPRHSTEAHDEQSSAIAADVEMRKPKSPGPSTPHISASKESI